MIALLASIMKCLVEVVILLSIIYRLKPVLDLINNRLGVSIPLFMTELKLKLIVYLMLDLFGLVIC